MSEIRTRHQEESTNLMLQPILYNDIRYNTERLKAIFGMESTLDLVLNILPLVDKPLVSISIFQRFSIDTFSGASNRHIPWWLL
jgi:hypothetical protein